MTGIVQPLANANKRRFHLESHSYRQRARWIQTGPWNIIALCCVLFSAGCSLWDNKRLPVYQTVPNEPNQDAEQAKRLNREGLEKLAAGEIDEAEKLFRESLASDVDYAPAHNNLGQVYLQRNQLYLAAWEFEFASSLMPDRPQSQFNLGLVYERANRLRDAQACYETALEIAPDNVAAMSNLARVCVKLDEDPNRVQYLLGEVVMRDSRPAWNRWAMDLLAIKYHQFGDRSLVPTQDGSFEHKRYDDPDPRQLLPETMIPRSEPGMVSPEVLPVPETFPRLPDSTQTNSTTGRGIVRSAPTFAPESLRATAHEIAPGSNTRFSDNPPLYEVPSSKP